MLVGERDRSGERRADLLGDCGERVRPHRWKSHLDRERHVVLRFERGEGGHDRARRRLGAEAAARFARNDHWLSVPEDDRCVAALDVHLLGDHPDLPLERRLVGLRARLDVAAEEA